jgi:thiamine kinase-like enzyme
MLAFGRSLGRMHALSAGQEAAHSATLESLGRAGGDRLAAARRVREEIAKLPATFDELDFEWSPGMVDDVQQLTRAILEPGPLLVLSHGDPCPDNDRLVAGRLVLFDFERADFRSAMVDAAYGRVPFPTCWCANRLPDYVIDGFEVAYRLELMKAVAEAGDDAFFERSLMEAAGWWLITTSNQLLPRALRFEERWGISTYRQRLLLRFEEFSRRATASGYLEALGAWAWLMHERLRARWPEVEEMPLYPAFR